MLVISPFAKQNFVDHSVTSQSSILRFIEDNRGLGRIGNQSFDQTARTLSNLFNFSGKARTDTLILDPATGEPGAGGYGLQTSTNSPGISASQMTVTIITDQSGTFGFSPMTLTVPVGTTVTWKNTTQAAHTVTSDDAVTFDSGAIPAGGTFTFTFTKAGSYAYHCDIYPYMTGTIIVK